MINQFGLIMTVGKLVTEYKTSIDAFVEKPTKVKRKKVIEAHQQLDRLGVGLSGSMVNAMADIMVLQQMNKQQRFHIVSLKENRDSIFETLDKINDGFKRAMSTMSKKF